ncbi:S4 domain-containing protein YaaA [Paenibacillus alkalitolerans]|uniref:S4 domain-containing protein YaaA n=1 Tax=Paenibacillus alkalitolerans TaxID=2799335 RepID=UPI0018F27F38|nr:S4 domain-containing protein YaaA [Paenibacillus alkalitolerans]
MKQVTIHTEYVTLGQLLKITDCISTGGAAKPFLAETKVTVNGESENRRGRKLYRGDRVDIQGFGAFEIV